MTLWSTLREASVCMCVHGCRVVHVCVYVYKVCLLHSWVCVCLHACIYQRVCVCESCMFTSVHMYITVCTSVYVCHVCVCLHAHLFVLFTQVYMWEVCVICHMQIHVCTVCLCVFRGTPWSFLCLNTPPHPTLLRRQQIRMGSDRRTETHTKQKRK